MKLCLLLSSCNLDPWGLVPVVGILPWCQWDVWRMVFPLSEATACDGAAKQSTDLLLLSWFLSAHPSFCSVHQFCCLEILGIYIYKKWPSYRGGRLIGDRLERFYCIVFDLIGIMLIYKFFEISKILTTIHSEILII